MAITYEFKSGNDTVLPTIDGEYFTGVMYTDYTQADVYFEFYSDADGTMPVTPTAGTISIAGSPMGNAYLAASTNPVVSALGVSHPNATYEPPTIDGRSVKARITLSGITGAAYMRAIVYKH